MPYGYTSNETDNTNRSYGQVMSRAIALYMDRVSASVAVLQNLENDEKSRSAPEAEGSPTKTPADTSPTTTSTGEWEDDLHVT